MSSTSSPTRLAERLPAEGNVVERLRELTAEASRRGFEVRAVLLDETEPSWCQVGPRRLIFLDASHTASEQLGQLRQILEAAEGEVRGGEADPAATAVRRTAA